MKVTYKAYAKINLTLDILGKAENGYHDLYMLMQSVGIYDTVSVESTKTEKTEIECDDKDIPTDSRNIVYKAAEAFFAYTDIKNPGIKISILKRIPHAAGLAGGSADGAATVRALKDIFCPSLCERDIIEICSLFGSDVPFCAIGGTMLAQGTGTVLTYLRQTDFPFMVIVKPNRDVSTKEAYSAFDSAENVRHPDNFGAFKAILNGDKESLYQKIDNVFEQFIFVPERVPIKSVMRKHGAKCACMSGSGPSVFGIFESKEDAQNAAKELKKSYSDVFVCQSKRCGVEPEQAQTK